jgi:hypothetical protein
VGEELNSQILVNLPLTNVSRCVSRNAKTIGLQHLQLPDVAAGSGSLDRICVINHRKDKLLVEQHTVSDGQAASSVTERAKYPQFLSCLLSRLVHVHRPSKLSIKGHPKIPRCFDPLCCLSDELHCCRFLDASRCLDNGHSSALRHGYGNTATSAPVYRDRPDN